MLTIIAVSYQEQYTCSCVSTSITNPSAKECFERICLVRELPKETVDEILVIDKNSGCVEVRQYTNKDWE